VWGNVNRAVSGFVSGDGQTGVVYSSPETARAMNDSMHTLIRRSGSKAVESWRYKVIQYWATVEVGKKGNKRRVGPSQAMMEACSAHGGMGCNRFGVRPKQLVDAVEMEMTDLKLGWIGKQLRKYGSKAAVSVVSEKLHRHGLKLRDGGGVTEAHALGLIGGSLPAAVSARIRHDEWERIASWYDANRACVVEEIRHQLVDKEVIARQVGFLNPAKTRKSVWDVFSVLDEAVAMTVGPIAPAGVDNRSIVVGLTNDKVDVYDLIMKVGSLGARSRLMYALHRLGYERTKRCLSGARKFAVPSSGVVPVTHSVIRSYCLSGELVSKRTVFQEMDDDEFQQYVTAYSYEVDACIAGNNYWQSQLNY